MLIIATGLNCAHGVQDIITVPDYATIYGTVSTAAVGGGVAVGDVNGDGIDDFVTSAYNGMYIYV